MFYGRGDPMGSAPNAEAKLAEDQSSRLALPSLQDVKKTDPGWRDKLGDLEPVPVPRPESWPPHGGLPGARWIDAECPSCQHALRLRLREGPSSSTMPLRSP